MLLLICQQTGKPDHLRSPGRPHGISDTACRHISCRCSLKAKAPPSVYSYLYRHDENAMIPYRCIGDCGLRLVMEGWSEGCFLSGSKGRRSSGATWIYLTVSNLPKLFGDLETSCLQRRQALQLLTCDDARERLEPFQPSKFNWRLARLARGSSGGFL